MFSYTQKEMVSLGYARMWRCAAVLALLLLAASFTGANADFTSGDILVLLLSPSMFSLVALYSCSRFD